jgi:hypothetical protein
VRETVIPKKIAERLCRHLNLPFAPHGEQLEVLMRQIAGAIRENAVSATRTICLEIAEDEAERSRAVGASTAQQTALNIAARIRRRVQTA